jgi:hypothetical protein
VLGAGAVRANFTPNEFDFAIGTMSSAVATGATNTYQKFYSLPSAASFALPADPSTCATDPGTCLPATAQRCLPGTGCAPRVMIVNKFDSTGTVLQGAFDLATKAFIARAVLNGTKRTLMSLGTDNDAKYHDLLATLSSQASAQGIDLMALLATTVRLRTGTTQTTLSLLNGLQVSPSSAHGGVQIITDPTVQAGVLLDVYASFRLAGGACLTNKGDSDPSTAAPDRYTRNEPYGYTVQPSDLLPAVPRVGPLGAIVGGPVYHVLGKFDPAALTDTASAVIGVDTAADEPAGYPVWVEPFLSGTHVDKPKTMDFLGTATWSASETPLGTAGCLTVDFSLGTGAALFDNPLPVGFGELLSPAFKPSPAAETLTQQVDQAVQTVVDTATANPTVSGLLTQITSALPL